MIFVLAANRSDKKVRTGWIYPGRRGGGATPEDIIQVRRTVGRDIGVKASGGIRDYILQRGK